MIRKGQKGFTMIEIMLVVIIIGVLVAMVVPNLSGRGNQARVDIESNITSALDLYELDSGRYPSTEQGLKALLVEPTSSPVPSNWSGPYLKKKKIPVDPWGNAYIYMSPGVHNDNEFDLSSFGLDGVESDDDITNWADDEDLGE